MKKMLDVLCSKAACAIVTREKKERGDHLIEVLGTIAIAVVVLVIFREQIAKIVGDAFKSVSTSVTNLFSKIE